MSDAHGPILFFDGVCGLCSLLVDFSLRHDRNGLVRFAPLQGAMAAALLTDDDITDLDTVVFADDGVLLRHSSAVVGLLRQLGGPWRFLATLLWLVPRPLRDVGYRIVARSRYRIFGRKDTCRVPTPGERERFLDSRRVTRIDPMVALRHE